MQQQHRGQKKYVTQTLANCARGSLRQKSSITVQSCHQRESQMASPRTGIPVRTHYEIGNQFKKYCIFLKVLFIFRESGREGEREGKKH